MIDLRGKKAIITGASRSFGREMAVAFGQAGAEVVISYGSDEAAAAQTVELVRATGSPCQAFQADFRNPEAVEQFAAEAVGKLGGVDVLVNNAALRCRKEIFEASAADFAQVYQVNTIAPMQLTQAAAKNMIDRQVHGRIINISSIAAQRSFPRGMAYACSKQALERLTKGSALQLAKHRICVNGIAPGVIASGMNETTVVEFPQLWKEYLGKIPLERAGGELDIVHAALFFAAPEAAWITGQVLAVDGGHTVGIALGG